MNILKYIVAKQKQRNFGTSQKQISMKNFFQFLSESAAQQAARLGLQGDGHGGWYDRSNWRVCGED
jgi:hypothetical protein